MRRGWALLVAVMLASPAFAGMKAVYDGESEPRRLEIEIADNGDFRVGPPDAAQYALQIGKSFYLVKTTPEGSVEVVRVDDMATAIGKAMPPLFAALFSEAARAQPATPPKVVKGGTRTVAGFPGQVYKVTMGGSQPETTEFVMSSAPELAPVGRAIGLFMESTMLMAAPLLGEMATEMVKEMRSVFSLGTPLEAAGRFRLLSAGPADVPAARVTLPAEPLSLDEIMKRAVLAPTAN